MTPGSEARQIAEQFAFGDVLSVEEFARRGNINLDTYLVESSRGKFLLQRINQNVFPMPERVMAGMIASLRAQANNNHGGNWTVMGLCDTKGGHPYLSYDGAVWRAITFIENVESFKSLSDAPIGLRRNLAYEVGRGLARYTDLTADIDANSFAASLPGYRDTSIYFAQLEAALAGIKSPQEVEHLLPTDLDVRTAVAPHFVRISAESDFQCRRNDPDLAPYIEVIQRHRDIALDMHRKRIRGEIRTTLVHGDTKIENFLFDSETHRAVSLVDLDTVMPHTWLSDWGDMARSLCNEAGEKTRAIDAVDVHREYYAAALEGFLSATSTATPEEIELMPRAVQWITLELGARFLADYLRGDTYFALADGDPPDLNKVRAMVQIRLFEKLLEHESTANSLVRQFRPAN